MFASVSFCVLVLGDEMNRWFQSNQESFTLHSRKMRPLMWLWPSFCIFFYLFFAMTRFSVSQSAMRSDLFLFPNSLVALENKGLKGCCAFPCSLLVKSLIFTTNSTLSLLIYWITTLKCSILACKWLYVSKAFFFSEKWKCWKYYFSNIFQSS